MTTYKNNTIETILTSDNNPVYITMINGVSHSNLCDKHELKAIIKAQKYIDKIKR